jgi:hypothetical protein
LFFLQVPRNSAGELQNKVLDTCTAMFTAALFTTAELWKQPRCPTTNEWIKKMWYTHNGVLLSHKEE